MKRTILLFIMLISLCLQAQMRLTDLRVEGMAQPLGIDNVNPHFSWKVVSDTPQPQQAYEIEVASSAKLLKQGKADLWVSGKVTSAATVMVPYGGKALQSRQLCYWRVRAHGNKYSTKWSAPQRFSVGILAPDKLQGQFIGLSLGQENAVMLRRSFRIGKTGQEAFLHVNSLGYHQAYINGKPVSEAALAPAVSHLYKRSYIVTYDVTPLLQRGDNELVLWIGSGWYKKTTFGAAYNGPAVRAQLDMLKGSEWQTLLTTDASWQGTLCGYQDLGDWRPHRFGGERIDARTKPDWQRVQAVNIDTIQATPQMCPATVVREIVKPVGIKQLSADSWLLDMGRVLNCQMEMLLPQLPAGHEVKVVYGDHIDENGHMNDLGGYDLLIASGRKEGDTFCNRFNHHCFRYATISNLPNKPDINNICARRIGMDMVSTGSFESSDSDLNAIHDMLVYTMDNLIFGGYMVDCATIERLGYGGDGNASTLSVQNNFDAAPMYFNWLQAWSDSQRPDGGLPHTAPNPYTAGGGPYWCSFPIQAAWRTWQNYGDDRMIRRYYDNMKLWLRYVDANTRDGLLHQWPDTDYRGWYLGDWIAPEGVDYTNQQSVDLVNNCALSQSYNELIQIAEYLGKTADKLDFQQRQEALKQRIHETFYHPDTHTYATGSQIDMTYPLLVGVVPTELQEVVKQVLQQSNDHIGVGLVGVPILAEWATLAGEVDYLYQILKQPDYPGYLYMIRNGATGTWEAWDKGRARSHFHNCYNGIDSWFYQALGGIIPTSPGYREVLIAPQTPQGLDWVRVSRETPYGPINVQWQRQGSHIAVHAEIPNGITASLGGKTVTAGTYDYNIPMQ